MNPLVIAVLGVLVLLALPVARWIRAARWQWAHAKHVMRAAEEDVEAATVFYGSMNLDDERDWITVTRALHHELPLDWHERTMVELAPEALDVDDAIEQACESDRLAVAIEMGWLPAPPDDPGPGVASSPDPPPGPVQDPGPGSASWTQRDRPGPADLPAFSFRPIAFDPARGFYDQDAHQWEHERLAGIGDIHEAHQSHPHPEDGWLDAQLADLYDWVRAQLEAA